MQNRPTTVVIAKKVGRLANRLLLFAHFIGAAVEHGFVVLNPSFVPFTGYFPSTSRNLLCRFPAARQVPAPTLVREALYRACLVVADAVHARPTTGPIGLIRLRREDALDLNSDVFVDAVRRHRFLLCQDWFFRNSDNCARHRDVIRSYFTPHERHLAAARDVVAGARRRDRFVVGIHVRRTDYERFKDGRFFYSHPQYERIAARVEAAFPDRDVSFVVCSDAPVPPGTFAGVDASAGTGHELEDLYALSMCDALVGPPSTYTTWASYYGGIPRYVVQDPDLVPDASAFETDRGLGWTRHTLEDAVTGAGAD